MFFQVLEVSTMEATLQTGLNFSLLYRSTLYKIRAPDLVKGLLVGLVLLVTLQVPVLFIFPKFGIE